MDTVQSTAKMEPVIIDDRITSGNEYAIGVDNRAGVTILLQAAKNFAQYGSVKNNIVYVFTVCEEIGPEAADNLTIPSNVIFGNIWSRVIFFGDSRQKGPCRG